MKKKIIAFLTSLVLCASLSLFPACEYFNSLSTSSSDFEISSSVDETSTKGEESSNVNSTSSSEEILCAHEYGEWETVKEASCIAGQKQRVCSICNAIETEEIPALDDFSAHTFDENTLCTTCGHQEFIESEEYIEVTQWNDIIWHNWNQSYALRLTKSPIVGNNFYHVFFEHEYGTPKRILIPSYFEGIPITTIGGSPGGFANIITLEELIIPETITDIVMFTLGGNINLKKVTFVGNGLINLDQYTFHECVSLTEITFPKSLIELASNVFYGCTSMKRINISHSTLFDAERFLIEYPYIEVCYYD